MKLPTNGQVVIFTLMGDPDSYAFGMFDGGRFYDGEWDRLYDSSQVDEWWPTPENGTGNVIKEKE